MRAGDGGGASRMRAGGGGLYEWKVEPAAHLLLQVKLRERRGEQGEELHGHGRGGRSQERHRSDFE